jgi:hypothetical protein
LRARINIGFKNNVSFFQDISVGRKGHTVSAEQLLVNYILQEEYIVSPKLFITENGTFVLSFFSSKIIKTLFS